MQEWTQSEDPTLKLCEKREIIAQILSVCQVLVVLTHGRYNRRFDKVLQELADMLKVERKRKQPSDTKQRQIKFVIKEKQ